MRMQSPNRPDKRALAKHRSLLFFALAAALGSGCQAQGPRVHIEGHDGKTVQVAVEIVSTPETQRRGLMWRTELAADHGMLFVFGDDAPRSFWMKNTPLPLDIIFIDSEARVVSVAEDTVPYSLASVRSTGPARYVLEVNSGFSRRHAITPGSRVTLPPLQDP
jgi:uncharacterized membrane protein (UPF0127 family)